MRAASSSGSFEPVPSPAVSPQGPVPNVQPVRGGPGGPVADTQHLFVIPQGSSTNAETFEPDNTMTLRDRGPLALELAREGELVPWTRDAIHRVAERPDKQAGTSPGARSVARCMHPNGCLRFRRSRSTRRSLETVAANHFRDVWPLAWEHLFNRRGWETDELAHPEGSNCDRASARSSFAVSPDGRQSLARPSRTRLQRGEAVRR